MDPRDPKVGGGGGVIAQAETIPTDLADTDELGATLAMPAGPELQLAAGRVLDGRYEVRERLGAGGMGTVFAAWDRLLEHQVALKFIRPQLAVDPRERERLRAEVKLAQAVTHANIARTYTLEETEGHLFIVMELLRGVTLQAHIAKGPLDVDETLRVARDLLAALGAAHKKGIVHRDVKPANIKLCEDGRVVVMDFGIARAHDAAPAAAGSGSGLHAIVAAGTHSTIGGTPGYIAPEVVRGLRAGARADLYSVGVVLYEMLSGKPPFAGRTPVDLLLAHVDQEIPDVSTLRPDVPKHIAEVVRRLLAKEPEARFATAEEVAAALEPPAAAPAVSAEIATVREMPPLRARSRKTWIVAAAAVVVIAAGAVAAAVMATGGERSESASETTDPAKSHDPNAVNAATPNAANANSANPNAANANAANANAANANGANANAANANAANANAANANPNANDPRDPRAASPQPANAQPAGGNSGAREAEAGVSLTREPQPATRPTPTKPTPTKRKPIGAVVPEAEHGPHTPVEPEPASRRAVEERKKLINLEE